MPTINKRVSPKTGKTSYRVQIRVRGHNPVTKTFSRLTDAKSWGSQTEADIKANRYGVTAEAEKHTLREMTKRYYEVVQQPTARQSIVDWWTDQIGELTLNQVNRATIIEQRDLLATEKPKTRTKSGKRSPATVNRYLANISIVFSHAIEWGWIENNPVKGIRRGKETSRVRYLGQDGKPRDEKKRLLDACESDPILYALVTVALNTGARAGELKSLTWADINFKDGRATLRNTKNGSDRVIPITGAAMRALKELRGDGRIGLVFEKDGVPYDYDKPFAAAVKSAGIKDFRFHDLRHHAASILAIDGCSLPEIAHLLGHKSLQVTMRYAHLSSATVDKLGARLDALNSD